MQILALELENTKSYTSAKIDFSAGVNAIVGHNGAGKSTILEAIGFTLFDCIDYKQTEFIRDGAKTAMITVTIASSEDERRYQVIRRCGASNQHYIYDPDLQAKVCEGKADVMTFLRQHMGVDVATDLTGLFKDAVGVPQGTFTAVFLEPPTRRKTTFDPLLQVEEFKLAVDKLLEPQRLLQKRQQQLEVQMKGLETRLERLPTLEASMQRRASELDQTMAQVQQTEAMLRLVEKERETVEAIQQKANGLRTQHAQATQRQQSQEAQLRKAEAAYQQAFTARTAVQQNLAGYERYLAAQTEQKALETKARQRQQLEAQRAKLDKTLAISQNDLAAVQNELNGVAAAEKTLVQLAEAVQTQLTLEKELAVAQQQGARLHDAQAQLAKQEQELKRFQQRLENLHTQLERAKQLETARFAGDEQLEEMHKGLDEFKDTLARCKAEADAIKQQNSALENVATARCPVCEQALTPAHRTTLLQRNEARITALRSEYGRVQQQVKTMETGQKTLQAEVQQMEQELRRLPRAEEAKSVEQEIGASQAVLADLKTHIEQLADAPQKVKLLTEQLKALGNPSQQSAIAAERARQRPKLEEKAQQVKSQMANTQAQITALQEQLAQFAGLETAQEQIAAELQQWNSAYQAVLINRQMADTLDARTAEVEQYRQTLQTTEQECQRLGEELKVVEAQFDRAEFHRLVAEEQQLRSQHGGLQTKITLLCQEQTRDQAEIDTLKAQQAELAELQKQKQMLNAQDAALDSVRGFLKQAGPYVTKALIKQISGSAAQTFSEIMQDYSRHLTWSEDYGINLEVDGRPRQFAQLSGGEQMTAALAVRLALLREMSNIDVAFFDEPTTNLDETRRSALARQILEIKGFRQLFVISHDDSFEQATQNLIRIARVNGASMIVRN